MVRKRQSTPVFLPRESRGQRSVVGCCPQGHKESDMTEATQYACMNWRRKWQHTPVFLPGESQGQRSLVGCYLWGRIESDTTEVTSQQQQQVVKNLPSIVGDRRDTGSILGLERLPWRRAWQPTPVFLCGKSHGQRSLVGYSPQCHKELDTAQQMNMHTCMRNLIKEFSYELLTSQNGTTHIL